MLFSNKNVIIYVVDSMGWVQHRRVEYLHEYQNEYKFRVFSARQFLLVWRLGLLRSRPVVFSSWRIVHRILKEHPNIFSDEHFRYFLGAVTSHSNIGGGLDPLNPIPNRTPEEAYNIAVKILKKFAVVTVNSRILYDLVKNDLPDILYCPNGVDCDFFRPNKSKTFNKNKIRIGWVGKERGPKNFSVIREALTKLEKQGCFVADIIHVEKQFKKTPLKQGELRNYYNRIDFYLCASWNEGTPNPALEAAASGVPVVTTRVGNMPQLIIEGVNGFFIDPTEQSILDAFNKIKDLSTYCYIEMSESVRDRAIKDWSWNKRINGFTTAIDALVYKSSIKIINNGEY